jgi:hypothetical protein
MRGIGRIERKKEERVNEKNEKSESTAMGFCLLFDACFGLCVRRRKTLFGSFTAIFIFFTSHYICSQFLGL